MGFGHWFLMQGGTKEESVDYLYQKPLALEVDGFLCFLGCWVYFI